MGDVLSKEQRHLCMSNIKNKDTKPEQIVRKYLFKNGLRFRINVKSLPGKPDIVLRKWHTVIFVNGCFWHGHDCKHGHLPKTNTIFWASKIGYNRERDKIVHSQLKNMGWRIIDIWDCQLKPSKRDDTLKRLLKTLSSDTSS